MMFIVIKYINQMIYKGFVMCIFVLLGKIQSFGFIYIYQKYVNEFIGYF